MKKTTYNQRLAQWRMKLLNKQANTHQSLNTTGWYKTRCMPPPLHEGKSEIWHCTKYQYVRSNKLIKMKCKLCKTNDLDNTGAHYLTESIIRSAVSEEGKKGRDNEIMFSASISNFGQNFIGRNIKPEKIKEIKGHDITEEELADNENMLIDFELVCRPCEKKFNPIETHFITEILRNKIEANTSEKQLHLNENAYKATLLFLLVNVWRTSASVKPHFKLKDKYEEELRELINSIQNKKIDQMIGELNFETGILSKTRFALYYFNQTSGKKSENQIALTSDTTPHIMIINQFVFLIFFDYPTKFDRPSQLADLTSKNTINKLIKGQPTTLTIQYTSDDIRKKTINRMIKEQIRSLTKQVNYKIKTVHLEMYGFEAHESLYRAIKSAISKLPKDQINRHSINNIIVNNILLCGEYYNNM